MPNPKRALKTNAKARVMRWRSLGESWTPQRLIEAYEGAKATLGLGGEVEMPISTAEGLTGGFSAQELEAALGSLRKTTKRPFSVFRLVLDGEYKPSGEAVRRVDAACAGRTASGEVASAQAQVAKARRDWALVREYEQKAATAEPKESRQKAAQQIRLLIDQSREEETKNKKGVKHGKA